MRNLLRSALLVSFATMAFAGTNAIAQSGPANQNTEATPPGGAVAVPQQGNPANPNQPAPQEKPVVLKPGVIASYGTSSRTAAVSVTGTGEAPGDEPSEVSGSIKQLGNGRCEVVLSNSAEKASYSVSYAVVGTDDGGREAYRRSFSDTIGPKKSVSRAVDCRRGLSMQVQLKSGRKRS